MKNQTKILIGVLLILILIGGWLIWKNYSTKGNVLIQTDKTEYQSGDNLKVKIKNNLWQTISFSSCYPYYLERKNENWERYPYVECQSLNLNGNPIIPGKEKMFEISLPTVPEGLHRLSIPVCISCKENEPFREDKVFYSNEFLIK